MEKLFVPYEIAKQLKEKGFDELCFRYYNVKDYDLPLYYQNDLSLEGEDFNDIKYEKIGQISAPLYQQVMDWFRRKHKIHIEIMSPPKNGDWHYVLYKINETPPIGRSESTHYLYDDAIDTAIKEALKLI